MDEFGPALDERGEAAGFEAGAVVGDEADRADIAGVAIGDGLKQRATEQAFGLSERELDRFDRATVIRGGRDVPAELELRPVVRGATDPPGVALASRVLGEVELPRAMLRESCDSAADLGCGPLQPPCVA